MRRSFHLNSFPSRLLASDFGRDAVLTFSCQIVVMLSMLLLNKILSNQLSVEGFGQYNIIRRSSAVLSFVMLGGMGIAIPRYLPYYQARGLFFKMMSSMQASLIYVVILSILTFFICGLFLDVLSSVVVGEDNTRLFFVVLLYSFSMMACSNVYAYFRGLDRFKAFNLSQIVCQLILVIPVAIWTLNIESIYFLWFLLCMVIVLCIAVCEMRRYHLIIFKRIKPSVVFDQLKVLSRFSIPRMIADFLLFSINAFPLIYLGANHGLDIASFFSVGISLQAMVTPVFSILGVLLLPYVSKMTAKGDYVEADRKVRKLCVYYLAVAFTIVVLFCLAMPLVIRIFFSDQYLVVTGSARILVASILPSSIYYLYRNPVDAASVVPYNTIVLVVCSLIMVFTFVLAKTLTDYSWAFFAVMLFKGIATYISWKLIIRKYT